MHGEICMDSLGVGPGSRDWPEPNRRKKLTDSARLEVEERTDYLLRMNYWGFQLSKGCHIAHRDC